MMGATRIVIKSNVGAEVNDVGILILSELGILTQIAKYAEDARIVELHHESFRSRTCTKI
jgi:dihydrodipicolinate reductase